MQPRNQVLDNIKALGIIAVIVGHVSHIAPLSSWIYGFHMPLFFFLAGITWYFDSKQNFLLKKAKGLIVPYITFGLTSFAYWLLIESKFRGDPVTAQVVFDQMKSFAGVIVGGVKIMFLM